MKTKNDWTVFKAFVKIQKALITSTSKAHYQACFKMIHFFVQLYGEWELKDRLMETLNSLTKLSGIDINQPEEPKKIIGSSFMLLGADCDDRNSWTRMFMDEAIRFSDGKFSTENKHIYRYFQSAIDADYDKYGAISGNLEWEGGDKKGRVIFVPEKDKFELKNARFKLLVEPEYKFDVERPDFYLYNEPDKYDETNKRLIQIAEMGMELVGVAQFGVKGIMSGLYIENVWNFSDRHWEEYIDWVSELIKSKKEPEH